MLSMTAPSSTATATATTVVITAARRLLHVRPPVRKKGVGSTKFFSGSTHAFLCLDPDRFSVLGNIVASRADALVRCSFRLVDCQPIRCRPKAQTVVLRLCLLGIESMGRRKTDEAIPNRGRWIVATRSSCTEMTAVVRSCVDCTLIPTNLSRGGWV